MSSELNFKVQNLNVKTLKIPTTNHISPKRLALKSSPNGEISPNLVTLADNPKVVWGKFSALS